MIENSIVEKVIEQMSDLPDNLQQQVLAFVLSLRQDSPKEADNAWDVLESLAGTIEAPADWSQEHDHYLYGTPKQSEPTL